MARTGPKQTRGGQGGKPFDISRYNINGKKWKDRERANLEDSLRWMESKFGDISDVTGEIKKKALRGAVGTHEYGYVGMGWKTPKETLFDTGSFISTETFVHEFTHAVAETLAHNSKKIGFNYSEDFYDALRTESFAKAGMEEPKYDGRKWKDRAVEFPAIQVENYYLGNRALADATLQTLQGYWKRYRRDSN